MSFGKAASEAKLAATSRKTRPKRADVSSERSYLTRLSKRLLRKSNFAPPNIGIATYSWTSYIVRC